MVLLTEMNELLPNFFAINYRYVSWQAWQWADFAEKAKIESAFTLLCDMVIKTPDLEGGIHPWYADIMRCTLGPGQALINVFQGNTTPRSLTTISPDVVVIYRQTDSVYQQVLKSGTAEVVIRESPKRHRPSR